MQNQTMFRRQVENFAQIRKSPNLILKTSEHGDLIPLEEELFLCPLCLKIWSAIDTLEDMTQEHVPPVKLGGNPKCITCKRCNSEHGNKIDEQLVRWMNFNATTSGKHPSIGYEKARIVTESGNYGNLSFYYGENSIWELRYPDKANIQGHFAKLAKEIFSPKSKFTLTFKCPNERSIKVALLRIAYLEAFCALGYGCLFHEGIRGMQRIIAQLNHPEDDIFSFPSTMNASDIPDAFLGLNIVYEPYLLRSFFVVFDLDYQGYRERHGVFLPGARPDWMTTYRMLAEEKPLKFSITPCNQWDFNFVDNPWAAQEIWNTAFE